MYWIAKPCEWAPLEVDRPASVKPADDCRPSHNLSCILWPQLRHSWIPNPQKLWETKNISWFKLLNLGVICSATIDNQNMAYILCSFKLNPGFRNSKLSPSLFFCYSLNSQLIGRDNKHRNMVNRVEELYMESLVVWKHYPTPKEGHVMCEWGVFFVSCKEGWFQILKEKGNN